MSLPITIADTAVAPVDTPSAIVAQVARRHSVAPILDEIAAFAQLPDDWTSYGCDRPSKLSIDFATSVVTSLDRHGYRPEQVAPMADGGIALWYEKGDRAVRIEAMNDGEAAMAVRPDGESTPTYSLALNPATAAATVANLFS